MQFRQFFLAQRKTKTRITPHGVVTSSAATDSARAPALTVRHMGILSQQRRLNAANPYLSHRDDPNAEGSSTHGAVNGPPSESFVGHANNGLQPSRVHPVAYPEYPPVPDGGGSAPPGRGFVPQASALSPMSVAMPVHAVPVHHVYGGPDPNAPPEGARTVTGVARMSAAAHSVAVASSPPRTVAAALRGTSSPPTFSSASAPCSTGSRSITSSRCISASSSPPGPSPMRLEHPHHRGARGIQPRRKTL